MGEDAEQGLGARAAELLRVLLFEAKDQLSGVRAAVFFLAYGLWAGAVGRLVLAVDEQSGGQLTAASAQLSALPEAERAAAMAQAKGTPIIGSFLSQALMSQDVPPILMMVLYGSTAALPLFILLIGHDRVAAELEQRYTRYVLQRVHRGAYLGGKLIALWWVSALLVVAAQFVLLAAGGLFFDLPFGTLLASMPQVWAASFLLTFVYAAYTTLMSSVVQRPISALLFGLIGLFLARNITWVLSLFWPPAALLWVGRWDLRLFHLEPAAIGVFAVYGLVFTAAAWWALNARDL